MEKTEGEAKRVVVEKGKEKKGRGNSEAGKEEIGKESQRVRKKEEKGEGMEEENEGHGVMRVGESRRGDGGGYSGR